MRHSAMQMQAVFLTALGLLKTDISAEVLFNLLKVSAVMQ